MKKKNNNCWNAVNLSELNYFFCAFWIEVEAHLATSCLSIQGCFAQEGKGATIVGTQ